MQTKICKVIAQTEPVYVQSKKSENGQMAKCYIRLRELGGDYEDEYQCAVFGSLAPGIRTSWLTKSFQSTESSQSERKERKEQSQSDFKRLEKKESINQS